MGTRVDFYVGRGKGAEWLGSYPWDGYPDGVFDKELFADVPVIEDRWRAWVADFLSEREEGATLPEHGWPWPWDTSATTDYAYAWDDGMVYGSSFGRAWFRVDPTAELFGEQACEDEDGNEIHVPKNAVFPDMSSRKAATLGPRSGLMVFQLPTEES